MSLGVLLLFLSDKTRQWGKPGNLKAIIMASAL